MGVRKRITTTVINLSEFNTGGTVSGGGNMIEGMYHNYIFLFFLFYVSKYCTYPSSIYIYIYIYIYIGSF